MTGRVIVVGAGIAGLTAGYRLQQAGFDVTVLEADDHAGGKTTATRRDGFVLSSGATALGASYSSMLALARELGVDDQVMKVKPTIGIVRDGEVHWLRGEGVGAAIDFIRTKLIPGRSKLRVARAGLDAFRARKKAGYDQPALRAELDTESVGEYCDRRLDPEIRDRLIGPVMHSLFVVDPLRMSVADLHFALAKFLGGGLLGFRDGIDFVPRALAERLDVRTSAPVSLVEEDADGCTVTWTQDGEARHEHAAGVVITTPAPRVPELYPGLEPELQGILLEGIEQANFISVRVALRRRPACDGLMVAVPADELSGLGTVVFEHNMSPGAAPAGKGLIGALLSHEWVTPRMEMPDDELVDEILPALDRIVPGIADDVLFTQITRWQPGSLRSRTGMHKLIAEVDRHLEAPRRVQLAGDYLTVSSVNGSVVSGGQAARRLAAAISATRAVPDMAV